MTDYKTLAIKDASTETLLAELERRKQLKVPSQKSSINLNNIRKACEDYLNGVITDSRRNKNRERMLGIDLLEELYEKDDLYIFFSKAAWRNELD